MIVIPRFKWTALMLLVVLMVSAVWTVPAFADDAAPPVDPAPEATPPVDSQPVEDSQSAESAPSVTELLDQLPEGTDLVVMDSSGDVIPLASQGAADAIAFIDPVWCPTGVAPQNGTGGCTTSEADLYTLVNKIATNVIVEPGANGVIWIQFGPDASASPIVIDGLDVDLGSWENFSLTLKGGWNGTFGSMVTSSLTPSTFAQTISIINWNGAVTLSDIQISGAGSANTFDDNALLIDTTKNIQLDRVVVEDGFNSDGGFVMGGATLDNSGGIGTTVTVNTSSFQNNEGWGLLIFSAGVVTTNNLEANFNGETGAFIDNSYATTAKAVTLKGFKQFNNNGGDGLDVYSNGAITLTSLVANNNGASGAFLDNTTSLTNMGVTLNGSNQFMDNVGDGLVVLSHGAITAANLNATNNGGYGAFLDNCDLDPSNCLVPLAKTLKLTGVNTFNNNGFAGLVIQSFGAISVSNLTASFNGAAATLEYASGAQIRNEWTSAVTLLDSVGTWTLNGYGVFNDNAEDGLLAYSHGNMILNNLSARNNGDDGVDLSASKAGVPSSSITLKGVNSFLNNTVDGLYAYADGKITLSNILSSMNGDDGAELYNNTLGMGISLTGSNTFLANGAYGLYADSYGAITVSNLTASYNTEVGALLGNQYDPTKPYNVTLTGTNSLNDNGDAGLLVFAFGNIVINNLSASDNGWIASSGGGAYLNNFGGAALTPKAVTLTGSVNVNGNFGAGMEVYSLGAVTLTNVLADGNGDTGLYIENWFNPAKPQSVTLKGSNTFNNNNNDGLVILTYGAITMSNVTANWNDGAGAVLDNCDRVLTICNASTAKNITLTGVNSFIGNYTDGLWFDTHGSVILTRVNADGNDWDAVNDAYVGSGIFGTADGSITLICGHTFNNGNLGFSASSGYDLNAGLALVFKGIYSAFNAAADVAAGTPVTITYPCALP